ncbi:sulfatase-like hydrolase/transferase [Flagellimonas olearia]|uniref:Sulfatase-like hydrolase/transferase n=1 Tax=Flagellimonas olearia TaxID=552546 RepID=A0A6I1E0A8_9FLAO|nr:sulfatase [Allomuricauda olearia]KAB7529057.1 sulfatase-like hydrolase/transferase [Allomuricauda olearia]
MKTSLQHFAFVLLFGTLLLGCKEQEKEQEISQPNIVLFLVDDMGWQDTSVPFWNKRTPFNDLYHTPNMERLAAEGMKFTQAYATPVCSPTRISLITGMNAARHRVTNWTLHKNAIQPMENNHPTLGFPKWNTNGINPQNNKDSLAVYATPFPQILKDAGYFTVHTGKAHFGAIGTPGENPLNLGFDVNIAGHAAGAPESYYGMQNFGNGKKGKEIWAVPGLEKYHGKDIFLTEALTQEALQKLDSKPDQKPFFLYMAHYAVHTPIMGDPRFVQGYLDKGLDSTEAKYASMVEGMDKSLGDIMDYLEKKQLTENTIILFMSDNGGLSAVARGGEPHTHNKPLASGKGSIYEGGIREPMLVKWSGKTTPGSVTNTPVIIEDFFPTILEMAGVESPEVVQVVDGQSFTSLLQGDNISADNRPFFWHYPNEWGPEGPGIDAFSAIRLGDWKLIYFHKNQQMELYNIKEDIGETQNKVGEYPEKVKELAAILTEHLIAVDAQMPFDKATGEQVPWPNATQPE